MKQNYFSKLALGSDLPTEAAPGQPLVEIAGDSRVLIENHRGVVAYECNKIVIKVVFGHICICGNCLTLAYMSKHQLVVSGKIDSVSVVRRR